MVKKFGSEKSWVVKNFGSEKNVSEKFGGEKFGSQIHHTSLVVNYDLLPEKIMKLHFSNSIT